MTLDVQPPHDDEETTRHKFYVAITAALDNNTAAMNRIGEKLDDIRLNSDTVTRDFNEFKNKSEASFSTFIRGVSLVAVILGGSLSFVVQKGAGYMDRVETLERKAADYEIIFKPHIPIPDQIQALKSRVSDLENEHARIEVKGKAQ